jgi:hypothetical protein
MREQESIGRLADSVGLAANELAAFECLDDKQITHLVAALEEAQARQSVALEEAIQQALSFVPALMRRPILKILGR